MPGRKRTCPNRFEHLHLRNHDSWSNVGIHVRLDHYMLFFTYFSELTGLIGSAVLLLL